MWHSWLYNTEDCTLHNKYYYPYVETVAALRNTLCVNIIQNLIQYSSGTVNAIHDEVIGEHPCGLCFNMSMKCEYMAVNKYSMPATVFADFKKTSEK
jgi:hypothetical protein